MEEETNNTDYHLLPCSTITTELDEIILEEKEEERKKMNEKAKNFHQEMNGLPKPFNFAHLTQEQTKTLIELLKYAYEVIESKKPPENKTILPAVLTQKYKGLLEGYLAVAQEMRSSFPKPIDLGKLTQEQRLILIEFLEYDYELKILIKIDKETEERKKRAENSTCIII